MSTIATKSTKTFELNNGSKIPAVGLGTWQSAPNDAYNAVLAAIKAGYRHIDTAWIYGNEEEVGKAIKDSGIPRSELFVTTKLWNTDHTRAEEALDRSLKNLGLDYLDLYLIHWPVHFNPNGNNPKAPTVTENGVEKADVIGAPEDVIKAWKSLEKLYKNTDKLKAIGVSNFTAELLQKLLDEAEVVPAVNQIENHPYLPQHELVKFSQEKGVYTQAYSPLGSTGAPVLKDETIQKVADKYSVSPATIVISWQIWRGVIVLPKSVTEARIIDNLKTVELSKEDGELINEIYKTKSERLCDPCTFWKYDVFGTGKL